MTYNVFSGTLNPTQSINLLGHFETELIDWQISQSYDHIVSTYLSFVHCASLSCFSVFCVLCSVVVACVVSSCMFTVSQKSPTFTTYYNFYIHSSIVTIFGTNVAEKVGNQNVLYFPTTPNLCFCTTWGNRKPGNCIISLKCCMLFHHKKRNTVKDITWSKLNHPSLSKRSTGCTTQDLGREHSILLCVTHMLCVSQSVMLSVAVQKVGVVLRQAWSKNQWTVLMGYLTTSTNG